MGRASAALTAYNAGELSPNLFGRSPNDFEPAVRGLRTTLNTLPLLEGPTVSRGGSEMVAEIKNSDKAGWLVRFEFSTEQAYCLQFGETTSGAGYMWVFKDGGHLYDGDDPVEVACPWVASDLADLYFFQSADVLWIFHPDYQPRTLTRTSHTAWTLEAYDNEDGPYLDGNAVSTYTIQPSATTGSNVSLTAAGYASGAGPFASGDSGRHIRLQHGTTWGWAKIHTYSNAGKAWAEVMSDFGDTDATPDWRLGAWSETTGWPHCGTIADGRIHAAATYLEPQRTWSSMSGDYYTFSPSGTDGTTSDSSAITKELGGGKVNIIRSLVPAGRLGAMTTDGVWRLVTTSDEPMTPTNCQWKLDFNVGAANIMPESETTESLFVDRTGLRLHAFSYQFDTDGFVPEDLSVLASHITRPGGIMQIAYQQSEKRLWAVRADGTLLCCLINLRQKVVGWSKCVIAGSYNGGQAVVESIACIPGTNGDELWMIVKRTIDGSTKRYVERLSAYLDDEDTLQEDCTYLDSYDTFNGRNSTTECVFTLSNSGWAVGSSASLTASGHAPFTSGAVGRVYGLQGDSESSYSPSSFQYRVEIAGVTSSNAATVKLLDAIPAALQSNATPNWAWLASTLSGLDHLEGEEVNILADGAVQPAATVTNGQIDLKYRASKVHVGLGYRAYFSPMRPEVGAQDKVSSGKKKKITHAFVRLWRSLGIQVGPSLDNLETILGRTGADPMGEAPPLFTGEKRVSVGSGWEWNQDLYIVQDQPLPMKVLAVFPEYVVNQG